MSQVSKSSNSRPFASLLGPLALLLLLGCVSGHAQDNRSSLLGTTADGRLVHAYTLHNKHGVTTKLMDLGATILEINVPDRSGHFANVVLALKDLDAYKAVGPVNSVVGRYANRIANGVDIEGQHYPLVQNARGITLHGGTDPYSNRLWEATATKARNSITFTLLSPDGDQGFPGALKISVTYRLTNQDELMIIYRATTSKTTYLNLTNHVYFNLQPCAGCTILDQQLQVAADTYTPVDANGVPTGTELPVSGTALDFRKATAIGARISPTPDPALTTVRGYDHNFVLKGSSNRKQTGKLRLAATLSDPKSGRVLTVRTTEPGLQVFSGGRPHLDIALMNGGPYVQSAALALETQHFPDSPHHLNFPSTLLSSGATFHSKTVFRFSKK